MTAVFSDLPLAMQAVTQILNRGHLPSAIEFLDAKCLLLVKDILPFHVPGETSTLLIIEVDGNPEQTKRDIKIIASILKEIGATHLLPAFNEKEREDIWNVRRQVSLRIHDNYALYIPEDVVAKIEETQAAILAGAFSPFDGPVVAQDGREVVAAGTRLDDGGLWGMEFLVEGTIGTLN